MLVALIPFLFLVFLTVEVYKEKTQKLELFKNYKTDIEESANISGLIDALQEERKYSYVPPVLTITAQTEQRPTDKKEPHKGKLINYVHITITDNGIGFNPEYTDRMFSVFFRLNTKDKYEGTGLGLALCRKIVHRHKGEIYAEGKEGIGASFHILLPASV